MHAKSLQLCPALCNPKECSPLGSSVHGTLQARILEWVAMTPPGDIPNPGTEPASPEAPALQADSLWLSSDCQSPLLYAAWLPLLSPRSSVLRATEILPPGLKVLDITTKQDSCLFIGLPWWLSGKESACQYRRRRFNPWARKIPWRREWQPTPVFLPGDFHGQRSLVGYIVCGVTKSQTWLSG